MPRYFENGLLAAVSEGGKSAFGGVLALWAGFAWGGIIAAHDVNALHWTGIWGFIATLSSVGCPHWGWLLLPVLGVFFFGAIWREWNRLLVVSSLATLVGTIGLRYCWPWLDSMWPRPWHRLIYPIALLALTLLVPLLLRLLRPRFRPHPSSPTGPSSPSSPSSPSRILDSQPTAP